MPSISNVPVTLTFLRKGTGLVNKREIACYENVKFEAESCGGQYITPDEAIKDGKIVTGKTWQSHPEFYKLVFSCLEEANAGIKSKGIPVV
jgi:putative intracellular protease/amidase